MSKVPEKNEKASIVPPQVRANPAVPQPASRTAKKAKSKPKKSSTAKGFFIGIFISLILAAAAGAAFWFNLADLQTQAVTLLKLDRIEFQYLETKRNELAKTEADLLGQQTQLQIDQQEADKQAKANEKTRTELEIRQKEIDELSASLNDQKASIASIVAIYESMEPAKAAEILSASDDEETQLMIIKNMKKSSLSLILAEMAPAAASKLLNKITETASTIS